MVTKHFDQFINPGVHIPEMITAKTHIDDSMVKDAPSEIEAAKIISDFIGDAILVSHNAPFDVGFLNAIRAKAGMKSRVGRFVLPFFANLVPLSGGKVMNIEIANRLVDLRKKSGLSQEELAAKLGLSRQAVSKWERAEASPDTDNLICLAKLYGVSLDDLLNTNQSVDEIVREQVKKDDAGETKESPKDDASASNNDGKGQNTGETASMALLVDKVWIHKPQIMF